MSEPSSLVMQAGGADAPFIGDQGAGYAGTNGLTGRKCFEACTVLVRVGCRSEFDYDRVPWLNSLLSSPIGWGGKSRGPVS
jgi:hypothetical protein